MAAGDTFRAAASEQLEVWAERTGSDIVVADKDKGRPVPGNVFFLSEWNCYLFISIYLVFCSHSFSSLGGNIKGHQGRL